MMNRPIILAIGLALFLGSCGNRSAIPPIPPEPLEIKISVNTANQITYIEHCSSYDVLSGACFISKKDALGSNLSSGYARPVFIRWHATDHKHSEDFGSSGFCTTNPIYANQGDNDNQGGTDYKKICKVKTFCNSNKDCHYKYTISSTGKTKRDEQNYEIIIEQGVLPIELSGEDKKGK